MFISRFLSLLEQGKLTLTSLFKQKKLNLYLLLAISAFFLFDVSIESYEDGWTWHILTEIIMLSATVILLYQEMQNTMQARGQLYKERQRLQSAKQTIGKLSGELSDFISQKFIQWKLTKSETDVAWMMLKGLSFSEIASFREVKEKTVRQQAVAIYAKSATKNRMGFVAYFFEELLGKDVDFSS